MQLPSLTEALGALEKYDDSGDSTTSSARSSAFQTPSLMSARSSFSDFDGPLSLRYDLTDEGSVISSSEGSFTEGAWDKGGDCFPGLEAKDQDQDQGQVQDQDQGQGQVQDQNQNQNQSSHDLPREPESLFDFADLSSAFGLSDAATAKVQAIQAEMCSRRNEPGHLTSPNHDSNAEDANAIYQQSHCDSRMMIISVDEYVGRGNANKGPDYRCHLVWDEHLSLNRFDVQTCERAEEFLTSESTLTNVYFAQSYRDIVLEAAESLTPPARGVCIEAFASKLQQSGAGKMVHSTAAASEEEVQPAVDVSLDINVAFDGALEAVQFVLCRIAPNERSAPVRCFRHCNKAAALCMFVVAPPSARRDVLSLCRSFGHMFAGAEFRACLYILFEEMEVDEMNGLFDFDSDANFAPLCKTHSIKFHPNIDPTQQKSRPPTMHPDG